MKKYEWDLMGVKEKRIAVALLAEWTAIAIPALGNTWYRKGNVEVSSWSELPDYSRNLNDMHDAEQIIRKDGVLTARYRTELKSILDTENRAKSILVFPEFATADQKALAFVLTMQGYYEREKPVKIICRDKKLFLDITDGAYRSGFRCDDRDLCEVRVPCVIVFKGMGISLEWSIDNSYSYETPTAWHECRDILNKKFFLRIKD